MNMDAPVATRVTIRALARGDLDAVVAIDAAIEGRSRRTYFERRLDAALREPTLHAQFAAIDGEGPRGVHPRALAGRRVRTKRVRPQAGSGRRPQGLPGARGSARSLFGRSCAWAADMRSARVYTQAAWTDHAMLRWIEAMGFELAPEHVVDCAVAGGAYSLAAGRPGHAARGRRSGARDRLRRSSRQRLRASRSR